MKDFGVLKLSHLETWDSLWILDNDCRDELSDGEPLYVWLLVSFWRSRFFTFNARWQVICH